MGTKLKKTRKAFILFVILTFLMSPSTLWAKGGYDIYFMGINIKTFKGSNWMKIAAGATASILVHELGHALYLESRGKDWRVEPSSDGFAITTTDTLTNGEFRSLGRSGYLLQTGIGILLTSFDATAKSDFTKGWTGINMVQSVTHKWRGHNGYDDFEMIDRGQGKGDSSYRLLSSISIYNFLKANSETDRIIFKASGLKEEPRLIAGENTTLLFNDEPESSDFSMDTEISPSLLSSVSIENMKKQPKKGERQNLALLYQEALKPWIWQTKHYFQENFSVKALSE